MATCKQVLIVEDDDIFARLLSDTLIYDGFAVERASSVEDASRRLEIFHPDFVLLDLTLPGADGLEMCHTLVSRRERPVVIILSARSGKEDKIRGLDLGADDYLTKPFAFDELLARMRAVLRRRTSTLGVRQLGTVVVDFLARRATRQGVDLGLSHREFEVLEYLAERPNRLVTRDDLLHAVWGYRETPLTRSVDLAITRLRRKIEAEPHRPQFIRTVHGDGYMFVPETETT
jgi:DNA-binding response OmpR family regulator